MRKTLLAETVLVKKEGMNSKGPWTLLEVVSAGSRYSTFAPMQEGKTYDCEVVSETSTTINNKTGKPFVNLKITKLYPPKTPDKGTVQSSGPSDNLKRLATLEKRVTELEYFTGLKVVPESSLGEV